MTSPAKTPSITTIGAEKELPALPEQRKTPEYRFRHAIRRINVSVWTWELLSLMTSLSCVTAIVVLLAHFDNKPLPDWKYGLTLNGVVSLLAVTAKSSLVLPIAEAISQLKWSWFWNRQQPILDFEKFDSASRGPWSSFLLLCHPRVWNLACLGAALTIAAMAVEPSLQQIPTYVSLPTDVGNGSLPRAISYNYIEYDVYGSASVSSPMKGAIFSAIFNASNAINSDLAPNCPTGNCTWPTHSSLGVCSACQNLTDQTYTEEADPTIIGSQPYCRLHNGASIDINTRFKKSTTYYATAHAYSSISYPKSANASIIDVSYMYIQPEPDSNGTPKNTQAFEFILYFCVKTFSARMANGLLEEKITSTWPSPEQEVVQPMNITPATLCLMADGVSAAGQGYSYNCPYYNESGRYTLQPPGQDLVFTVNATLYNVLRVWLGDLLAFNYQPIFQGMEQAYNAVGDIAAAIYDTQRARVGSLSTLNDTRSLNMPGPDETNVLLRA